MLAKIGITVARAVVGYAVGYCLGEGIDKVQKKYMEEEGDVK